VKDAKARNIVSGAFDSKTSYDIGDYCIYEGILYKCTTAHTGAWKAAHFSATTIAKELKNLIAGGTLYTDTPIGSIVPYGGTTAPSGWLLCQGQAISRTTYSDLFSAIGTTFGAGNGSTTFNLPDLREATTKGAGLSGKSAIHYDSDGVALGEFVEDRVQDH
jgi:hypothetical protein